MARFWRRNRTGDDGNGERKSALFYFLGPPDLGDPNEPSAPAPRAPMNCTSCGRPMSEHVIDRSQGRSATYCPPRGDDVATSAE
ncbi:hypothetical protein [Motilibacter aurantiacus]|uniref:hypothetical protein n=1 Tax=Motilibacter aurantiacus TaxID=2714955 RepID=UPI00140D79D9|nr:hypothetical protein [Motilibacter aurantiacus]NHC46946.1 hypothetical protein [Motilibacter aurantiacus]